MPCRYRLMAPSITPCYRPNPADMTTKPHKRRTPAIRAAITGVHGHLPQYVLTNHELAKMVETTDAWIVERTGITRAAHPEGRGAWHVAHGRGGGARPSGENRYSRRARSIS